MKKMSKQDVETVIFENAKTGEALEFQHEQHKAEYGAKHFWKADKKFFELLSTFSAAESKVVAYILQKTQPTKNEFIGAYSNAAWRCRFRSTSQSSWIAAGKTRTKRTTAASVPRCCGHGHYRYRVG